MIKATTSTAALLTPWVLISTTGLVNAAGAPSGWTPDNVVRIDTGMIRGRSHHGALSFKGIPYAAPPIGNLRWRPPQPVVPWEGVRKAYDFSASCAQPPLQRTHIFYDGPHPTSEDCLYLNVWTAARPSNERRPVMLWIHDGGLVIGEGSRAAYDGETLSKKGLVVVTINYRLGVFGMLAHPELSHETTQGVSGNYALLDMVAAIKWTRRNIKAFGGDPERITLFGESVGSRAAAVLSTSPLVRGDIRGVIAADSIEPIPLSAKLADAESAGVGFLQATGITSIRDLRKKPADDLIVAFSKYDHWIEFVIDDWVLSSDVFAAERNGTEDDIPLLTGSTADHFTPFINQVFVKDFVEASRKTYGPLSDRFLALYPAISDAEATASELISFRDRVAWLHDAWAAAHTSAGHRAYLYLFTHEIPMPPQARTNASGGLLLKRLGAWHTGEIAYAFDSLDKLDRPWTPADRRLADIMSSYWVNFAAKGDPNGPGLPRWPAYGDVEQPVMELGDQVRAIPPVLSEAKREFWTDYFLNRETRN